MTEPLAEVTLVPKDDGPLIRVTGEVDMANADAIGRQIREAADTASPATLDLGPVTFFDSSALHMLQQLSGEFDRGGGRLTVIVAPDSIVGRLLAITHLDDYLHIGAPPAGQPL
jgi:anti-anti-sigma factor